MSWSTRSVELLRYSRQRLHHTPRVFVWNSKKHSSEWSRIKETSMMSSLRRHCRQKAWWKQLDVFSNPSTSSQIRSLSYTLNSNRSCKKACYSALPKMAPTRLTRRLQLCQKSFTMARRYQSFRGTSTCTLSISIWKVMHFTNLLKLRRYSFTSW